MTTTRFVLLFVLSAFAFGQDLGADAMQKYREELQQDPGNSLPIFAWANCFLISTIISPPRTSSGQPSTERHTPKESTPGRISTLARSSM
jgi:hypothetical protein